MRKPSFLPGYDGKKGGGGTLYVGLTDHIFVGSHPGFVSFRESGFV